MLFFQVFVCGSYPHWLFVTSRGALRAHPMNIDGAVTCFAPFHNVNCPKGFLYFNKKVLIILSLLFICFFCCEPNNHVYFYVSLLRI